MINMALLGFLVVVALAVTRLASLLSAIMLFGIYSLLSAALFVSMDAVDVAFTEAAVGAGISTVLILATLMICGDEEETPPGKPWIPLLVVLLTGSALIYGTFDFPAFGDPQAPVHQHVAPRYIQQSGEEIGIPNVVTSVLASYRGYDTLGEVTVIFTAAVGVSVLLIGRRRRKPTAGGSP